MRTGNVIATLLLAAALAADVAGQDRLSEKVTLELKDADVRDVLEKVAVLLQATPRVDPGVGGTVTLSLHDVSIGEVLKVVEKNAGVTISLEEREGGRILHAARAPGVPAAPSPEVRKFVFRSMNGVRIFHELGPWLVPVRLPGCVIPVDVALLRSDDGGRIVFPDGGGRARIVTPGAPAFRLPGCQELFSIEGADDGAAAQRAVKPDVVGPQFATRVKLMEVGRLGETVLAEPRVQSILGQAFQVRSGAAGGAGGVGAREIRLRGLVVEGTDTDAVLALSVTVDGESDAGKGIVRLAQADQTILLSLGKPERLLLTSDFGPAKSQLVAELTVTAVPRPAK